MTEFSVVAGEFPLKGKLVYRERDHAFDYEIEPSANARLHAGRQGTTALTIGTVQLEVGIETGNVLFVWGYHPRVHWQERALTPPAATPGLLQAHPDGDELKDGVAVELAPESGWTTSTDRRTGWIRIAQYESDDGDLYVEFAAGCVAGLRGPWLRSLWLKPG